MGYVSLKRFNLVKVLFCPTKLNLQWLCDVYIEERTEGLTQVLKQLLNVAVRLHRAIVTARVIVTHYREQFQIPI